MVVGARVGVASAATSAWVAAGLKEQEARVSNISVETRNERSSFVILISFLNWAGKILGEKLILNEYSINETTIKVFGSYVKDVLPLVF
jgi:hypothetical protein